MTRYILYALCGFFGGVLGGMGMGGGTVLIPALYLFFSLFQREASGINLISFVPMAIIAVILHAKNKLIKWEDVLYLALPASLFSVFSSFLSKGLPQRAMSVSFGVFLVALGVFQMIDSLLSKENQETSDKLKGKENGTKKM